MLSDSESDREEVKKEES